MVMEYLEGMDLAKVLEKDGPLPVVTVTEWILQACEAIAEAHAAGIVHRDLKPQNLFLARTVGGLQGVKVLDFGVSKSIGSMSAELGSLTRTRTMLGSPLYMSPEQMRSARDVDATADIWALGVVLFELLTGRWPYEAQTMPELCLKVVSEPPQSLAALRPEVPALLVAVIERCLSKDPAARYANAAELASALEAHVPPPSRIWAERARLAMSSAPAARASSYAATPKIAALSSAEAEPPSPTSTPSAWGTGGASGVQSWGKTHLLVAAAIASAAGVGVAVVALRTHVARPRAPVPHAEVGPAVTQLARPAAGPQATTVAEVAPATPSTTLATPSTSISLPAPSPPAAPIARDASPQPAASRAQAVGARPAVRDDDIPAIR
jgi:serine/threonine-protein kinase